MISSSRGRCAARAPATTHPAVVLDVVAIRCDGDRAVAAGIAGDAGINPTAIAAWLEPAGLSNVVPLRAGIDLDTDTLLARLPAPAATSVDDPLRSLDLLALSIDTTGLEPAQ